jgi:hypothetical protein
VSERLRSGFRAFAASDPPSSAFAPRMTDLSGALDHAAALLLSAPHAADRSVINVIGNGWDNVGEGPRAARDRVIATGGTINGVVLGLDPILMSYYRSNVIGGPGAFLLAVDNPAEQRPGFNTALHRSRARPGSPARCARRPDGRRRPR